MGWSASIGSPLENESRSPSIAAMKESSAIRTAGGEVRAMWILLKGGGGGGKSPTAPFGLLRGVDLHLASAVRVHNAGGVAPEGVDPDLPSREARGRTVEHVGNDLQAHADRSGEHT